MEHESEGVDRAVEEAEEFVGEVVAYLKDGTATEDAVAVIAASIGEPDFMMLFEQINEGMRTSSRAVACISELSGICAALLYVIAARDSTSPTDILQSIALKHHRDRAE